MYLDEMDELELIESGRTGWNRHKQPAPLLRHVLFPFDKIPSEADELAGDDE